MAATQMIAFRYWKADRGELISPHTRERIALPLDGIAVADCPGHPHPPDRHHSCGLYFHDNLCDIVRVVRAFREVVVTTGEVTGPVYPDHMPQRYWASNGSYSVPHDLPSGKRCSTYKVTTIYTNTDELNAHAYPNVPTLPISSLSVATSGQQ